MKRLLWLLPAVMAGQSAGSLFISTGPLANPARDLRASSTGDIVTIIVSDSASAIASGGTNSSRDSNGAAEVTRLLGNLAGAGGLANLIDFNNQRTLQGTGETTRDLTLTTTLSARVVATTLKGLLIVEGTKDITVNSERQHIALRGMIRPVDVSPANTVASNQISDLSVEINGKGVVNDAIKRPFFLFRILAGILP